MRMRTTALLLAVSLGLVASVRASGAARETLPGFGQAGQARAPRLPRAGSGRASRRGSAPRVGTIRDYEATGLMTGCANLYYYPANRPADAPPEAFVFLSRAGGEDAWMNLDGRDVRLDLLKTSTWYRAGKVTRWESVYRAGATVIRVVITPREDPAADSQLMTIIARRAGATRIVKAIGHADC